MEIPCRLGTAEADAQLSKRLEMLHAQAKGRYGLRRLDAMLRREGRCHSRRRLRRLARAAGIACVHPPARIKTTVSGQARSGLVDLVERDFVPAEPGQVLYSDITYIPTAAEGFVYLVLFTDAASRRIVAWDVADHMRTSLVLNSFDAAVTDLRPDIGQLTVHTDRGSQYTSKVFRDKCFASGVIPSVGRTGSAFDNATAESVNATIKKELINLRQWTNLAQVRTALFEYITIDYNRHRIHSGLGYLTPTEYETQHRLKFTEAA